MSGGGIIMIKDKIKKKIKEKPQVDIVLLLFLFMVVIPLISSFAYGHKSSQYKLNPDIVSGQNKEISMGETHSHFIVNESNNSYVEGELNIDPGAYDKVKVDLILYNLNTIKNDNITEENIVSIEHKSLIIKSSNVSREKYDFKINVHNESVNTLIKLEDSTSVNSTKEFQEDKGINAFLKNSLILALLLPILVILLIHIRDKMRTREE